MEAVNGKDVICNNNNNNNFICIAVYTKALYRFTIKKEKNSTLQNFYTYGPLSISVEQSRHHLIFFIYFMTDLVSGRNTRNMSQLNLPKCRLSTGQHSFAFREYNLLPGNI